VARTASDERQLTGRVADVAFRGRGYELAIDLPGHGRLTGVFSRHRVARGEELGLRLEPDGCHLFPADPARDTTGDQDAPAAARKNGALDEKAAISG
jgi:hypothetical protein